jgi:hypothetical protein
MHRAFLVGRDGWSRRARRWPDQRSCPNRLRGSKREIFVRGCLSPNGGWSYRTLCPGMSARARVAPPSESSEQPGGFQAREQWWLGQARPSPRRKPAPVFLAAAELE